MIKEARLSLRNKMTVNEYVENYLKEAHAIFDVYKDPNLAAA